VKGAQINPKEENGMTPLDWALRKNHADIAALLRKHGAK
jgi:ankyrin repeat protein